MSKSQENILRLSLFGQHYHGFQYDHGSFAMSLIKAFYNASPSNRKKLVIAFPEYFKEQDITLDYD